MTDHGDADDDDPQLGGLRSIWLSMPDEDPPVRGLADLMAAARVKAEEMAAPSLWQRIVAMMRRPPALALATVMVLVAGVVIVGNRREKFDAPPTVSQEGPAAAESTIAPAAPAMDPGVAPVTETPMPPPPVEAKPDVATGAQRPRGEPKKKAANKGTAPTAKPTKAARGELFEGMADAPAKQQAVDERRDVKAKDDAKPTLEIAKPEPPPPEERELGTAQVTESAVADSGGAAKNMKPAGVAQLHTQARSAAARKDCSTVKVLAQKIAKQDPAYYRANVANDAAITTCVGTAALQ